MFAVFYVTTFYTCTNAPTGFAYFSTQAQEVLTNGRHYISNDPNTLSLVDLSVSVCTSHRFDSFHYLHLFGWKLELMPFFHNYPILSVYSYSFSLLISLFEYSWMSPTSAQQHCAIVLCIG